MECSIEDGLIEGRTNPDTVGGFCTGEYTECRSWQVAKEVAARGGDLRKILAQQQGEASRIRSRKALRDARLRRQQELLMSDTPEGRRYRAHIQRVMAQAEMRQRAA